MNARARVESDILADGVRVYIQKGEPGSRILRAWGPSTQIMQDRGGAPINPPEGHTGWLSLDDEEARAVYQALGEYFGTQVSDNRLLRADYEAERVRVDKFIDAAIERLGVDR